MKVLTIASFVESLFKKNMQDNLTSAIVSGATGYIGRYLVDALLRQDVLVSVITRSSSNIPNEWSGRVQVIEADIADASLKLPKQCEVFFHCAGAIRHQEEFEQINVIGTENVLNACKDIPDFKRFIHLSSVGVMGCVKPGKYDETVPCNPRNSYEISKYKAELLVNNASEYFPVTIIRPSIVFGPGRSPELDSFLALVKSIKSEQFRLLGDDNSFYNIVYVEDLVQALVLLATTKIAHIKGKSFIINDPLRWQDFYSRVTALMGRGKLRRIPTFISFPVALAGSMLSQCGVHFPLTLRRYRALTSKTVYDSEKIYSELGFVPEYGVAKGIEKTIHSYGKILEIVGGRVEK